MKRIYFLSLFVLTTIFLSAQYTWVNKKLFPDSARYGSACFTINGKGYMVGGWVSVNPSVYTNQTWEYDFTNDTWLAKANYPYPVAGAKSFTINGKGYVVGGANTSGVYYSDLYEFDPVADSWTKRASFPENGIGGTFQFVIDSNAYLGSGIRNSNVHGVLSAYKYSPFTNSWSPIADYPGPAAIGLGGFAINGLGYAGSGGTGNGVFYNQFFEYNPKSNSWNSIASFPGKGRFIDNGQFVLNQKGYVGAGITTLTGSQNAYNLGDMYEYDPSINTWTPVPGLPGKPRYGSSCFNFENSAVIAGGYNHDDKIFLKQVAEFTVCGNVVDTTHVTVYDTAHVSVAVTDTLLIDVNTSVAQNQPPVINTLKVFPNPAKDHLYIDNGDYASMNGYKLKISNASGQDVFTSPINTQQFYIDLNTWTGAGTYAVYVINPQLQVVNTKLIIVQ